MRLSRSFWGRQLLFRSALCLPVVLSIASASAAGKAEPGRTGLRERVEAAARGGEFDLSLIQAIYALPRSEQAGLAAELARSPHPAMRRQAIVILQNYPPRVAAASLRKLLGDPDPDNRDWAALYLAQRTGDPKARAILLENARKDNATLAANAIRLLGRLKGPDVSALLLEVLRDEEAPGCVRTAAISAAGEAEAFECTPELARFLDERRPRSDRAGDSVRICDIAAAALERMYRVRKSSLKYVFLTGSVKARDDAIALWKQWYIRQGRTAMGASREHRMATALSESVKTLESSSEGDIRYAAKATVQANFSLAFCMGDLRGVDIVVAPSVQDLWSIMRASSEDDWHRFLNPWRDLESAYRAQFLRSSREASLQDDEQAAQFIRFADGVPRFPKVWVWSFCRTFSERFCDSRLLADVDAMRQTLNAGFRRIGRHVVVHGHIPVLEPLPEQVEKMCHSLTGTALLCSRLKCDPSNWELHQEALTYCALRRTASEQYPLFADICKLYPGNEWPFVANAAYQSRHREEHGVALQFADKALILDPGNPKAYAVRGMIRVVAGKGGELALDDLKKALELDPHSLGDEPETPQAACFLVEQTLRVGDKAAARKYLEVLGELKAFRAEQPLKDTAKFKELVEQVND